MVRAAILTPNLSYGGAERWVISLVAGTDPAQIKWVGAFVSGWGALDPDLCRELSAVCPVYVEKKIEQTAIRKHPTPAAASPDCEAYIRRVPTIGAGLAAMPETPDVLVAWGSPKYREYLRGTRIQHFVLVSHSSHHRPADIVPVPWCRTHLAAVSEAAKLPYRSTLPITVIYNGVSPARVAATQSREAMRALWGIPRTAPVLGYVGRQSPEKNYMAAVQALTQLPDWYGVYYGPFPPGTSVPAGALTAAANAVLPRCCVYPSTPAIGDVYAGLDALMLASDSEAFSLTLIEAWLAGVPVVATRVGSVPELEAKFGRLVVPVSQRAPAAELAAACRIATSPAGREIAERARATALRHFTDSAMLAGWTEYLRYVAGLPSVQRPLVVV